MRKPQALRARLGVLVVLFVFLTGCAGQALLRQVIVWIARAMIQHVAVQAIEYAFDQLFLKKHESIERETRDPLQGYATQPIWIAHIDPPPRRDFVLVNARLVRDTATAPWRLAPAEQAKIAALVRQSTSSNIQPPEAVVRAYYEAMSRKDLTAMDQMRLAPLSSQGGKNVQGVKQVVIAKVALRSQSTDTAIVWADVTIDQAGRPKKPYFIEWPLQYEHGTWKLSSGQEIKE